MKNHDFELEQFLPYLLNQAAEASSLAFEQVYKSKYGMLRTQWRVLFHLGLYGQLTASEIGSRAGMHKTKISRAVQSLTEMRFVARSRDVADRRVEHLTLTVKGRAAYDDLRNVAEQYDGALMAGLEPQEADILRGALIKLRNARDVRFT